jgi:hypothetical protein
MKQEASIYRRNEAFIEHYILPKKSTGNVVYLDLIGLAS